jgi:hypothetical protein
MEHFRACDALPYLRLKSAMNPSDCNAVLRDGTKTEVYLFRDKPTIEIGEQFYFSDTHPDLVCYERKPVTAPPPAPVQIVDKPVKEEVADTSGQNLRLQLQRTSSAIYRRNIIRQVFGNLLVTEYLGVGERDSSTRYWSCKCKLTGKYITATQGDLTVGAVTCCSNAKTSKETIVNRGGLLP